MVVQPLLGIMCPRLLQVLTTPLFGPNAKCLPGPEIGPERSRIDIKNTTERIAKDLRMFRSTYCSVFPSRLWKIRGTLGNTRMQMIHDLRVSRLPSR